ncbi:MAG: alpha/beta fold hydrolase [Steroidobacteraceae bacterium]
MVVHGLWMNGLESIVLRNRLARAGFEPSVFRYPSTRGDIVEAGAALAAELRSFDEVHLVGHSLGGLVILAATESGHALPAGRVVLLGSPVQGSRVARTVAHWSIGLQLMGRLAAAELTRHDTRVWRSPRELGIIAGSRSAGMGRLFAELPVPNDGTVCVDETRLAGASEHIVLDVSHMGMLVSSPVATSVAEFLRTGRFSQQPKH